MKFGLHINSQEALNSGWVQKFSDSPVHLVLADSIGSELARTQQVAALCPKSLIIYRAWSYGSLGQSDHFEWYYQKYGSDPMPLIDAHQPCYDKRVAVQFFNETGMDDAMWPRYIDFNTRLINEMSRRRQACAILGAGPGYPTGTRDEIKHKWNMARPIFDAINRSTSPVFINLHEYLGMPHIQYYPYLVGRYKWMLEDVADMGLLTNKIRVVAGENGWADPAVLNPSYPGNLANGYRGFLLKGYTPDQLAEDLVTAFKTVYDPDPYFVGSCHFCLGGPGWEDFDLLREPRILQRIYDLKESPVVIDTDVVTFRVVNGPLRKRVEPNLSSTIMDTMLQIGDKVQTNGYIDAEGYRWRRLVDGGFSAEYDQDTPFDPLMILDDWKTELLNILQNIRNEIVLLENRLLNVPE